MKSGWTDDPDEAYEMGWKDAREAIGAKIKDNLFCKSEIARLQTEALQAEQNWAADWKHEIEKLESEIERLRAALEAIRACAGRSRPATAITALIEIERCAKGTLEQDLAITDSGGK